MTEQQIDEACRMFREAISRPDAGVSFVYGRDRCEDIVGHGLRQQYPDENYSKTVIVLMA